MTGFEVKRWTENLEPFTSVTVGNLTVQITRSSKSGMTLAARCLTIAVFLNLFELEAHFASKKVWRHTKK